MKKQTSVFVVLAVAFCGVVFGLRCRVDVPATMDPLPVQPSLKPEVKPEPKPAIKPEKKPQPPAWRSWSTEKLRIEVNSRIRKRQWGSELDAMIGELRSRRDAPTWEPY